MPLTADAIAWARPRVQNFSEAYAHKLIHELVKLDGETFDKVRFFGVLVETGVLNEPEIKAGATKEQVYAKRWDSYLAPIRPFGLGFTVEERRTQSPNAARLIWRPSDIAYDFDSGHLDHRQFMALQLARTQFPKITMPLKDPAKPQLLAGSAIQPLRLFVEAVDGLMNAGQHGLLTQDEICQLARCRTHNDVTDVVVEITKHRAGQPTPYWTTDEPADLDILLNDLVATGYFSRPTTSGPKALVPAHGRWNEARELTTAVGWIDVTTDVGIEQYYERLMSSPTDNESQILRREPQTVKLVAGEVTLTVDELVGSADIVAGLGLDADVYVAEAGRRVRVVEPATAATMQAGGAWQATARVALSAFMPEAH